MLSNNNKLFESNGNVPDNNKFHKLSVLHILLSQLEANKKALLENHQGFS
jgi:hypothetical protein